MHVTKPQVSSLGLAKHGTKHLIHNCPTPMVGSTNDQVGSPKAGHPRVSIFICASVSNFCLDTAIMINHNDILITMTGLD